MMAIRSGWRPDSITNGLLQADQVSLRRQGRQILEGIQLQLQPGRVHLLLGPNGAGKSSLLAVLAGLLRPDAGMVSLDTVDLQAWPPLQLARRRALLAQSHPMEFGFTAEQVVMLGRSPYWQDQLRLNHRIVAQAMHTAQATGLQGRSYPSLSGGEQKRVQLARVLAQVWGAPEGPAWILLDEPEAALDVGHQHALMRSLQRLAGEGYGVIAAIHDLALAARYAEHIVLLQAGRQVAAGTPETVLSPERVSAVYGVTARRLLTPAGSMLWLE